MFTLWFTGLSGSGKTTLATKMCDHLKRCDIKYHLLDGDEIRNNLNQLGFSKQDRLINIDRIRYICKLLNKFNIVSVVSAITPYTEMRDKNRLEIKEYVEVFCNPGLDECIKRDVKGLYKKALNGEIKHFTGIDDPFEVPQKSNVIIDTKEKSVEESHLQLIKNIKYFSYLNW